MWACNAWKIRAEQFCCAGSGHPLGACAAEEAPVNAHGAANLQFHHYNTWIGILFLTNETLPNHQTIFNHALVGQNPTLVKGNR